jgi:uncharacterized protein
MIFKVRRSLLLLLCSLLLPVLLLLGLAVPAAAQAPESVEVQLATPTGTLYGTQILPASGRFPSVLIIAGSGPTDRNGNSSLIDGENNSLKLLAEGLAEQGIASVRYDKRGIGESAFAATREADVQFDNLVEDAALWIQQLQTDARVSSVTVVGHSEGSLIGMLAAQKAGADAFVSIAGPARSAPEILREQLRPRLPEALWQASEQILAELEQSKLAPSVPPELNFLYRPSVQPYLISWFRYTPAEEINRLTVPVLITQGTTDLQVPVAEAEALKQAKPEAKLKTIENMNHVLKLVPLDRKQQIDSYSDPTLPVAPELVEAIAEFIDSQASQR